MRYFPRRVAGANGLSTAATGLADLWPFECAAAAAKLNPAWNKKKCRGLLTNRISLDIFGYIRGGNSAAPKNEGKLMSTTFNTTFESADAVQIPKTTILITFYVFDRVKGCGWHDYVIKEFEIIDLKEFDFSKMVHNVLEFKQDYMNGHAGCDRYRVSFYDFLIIEHREV